MNVVPQLTLQKPEQSLYDFYLQAPTTTAICEPTLMASPLW